MVGNEHGKHWRSLLPVLSHEMCLSPRFFINKKLLPPTSLLFLLFCAWHLVIQLELTHCNARRDATTV
jgi:hypothetical protein